MSQESYLLVKGKVVCDTLTIALFESEWEEVKKYARDKRISVQCAVSLLTAEAVKVLKIARS